MNTLIYGCILLAMLLVFFLLVAVIIGVPAFFILKIFIDIKKEESKWQP